MRIKNYRPWIIVSTGFVLFVCIFLVILNYIAPKPPFIEVTNARVSLAEARVSKAQHYVPLKYARALGLYNSLITEWKRQNDVFFLKRDFSRMEDLAETIIELSEDSKIDAKNTMMNLETMLGSDLEELKNRIDKYDSVFKKVPLSKLLIEKYTQGKLLYLESKSAFENKNFNLSYNKIQLASELCNEVIENTNQRLRSYFGNYNTWTKLADDIIVWSRKNKEYALVVDKFAKACIIYYCGKPKEIFDIELGPNWIGSKRHKGDNATPEGRYMVTKKFTSRDTKYHKALLLNYPNDLDQQRFNEEIKNGTLPKSSDIGGLIEIHGEGGKGFHWTNGCIALNNNNMDIVFKISSIGTPVVVIGSLKKLSELFNLD